MKAILIIEDTTKGIYPELRWQGNGVSDHLSDSLAMHLVNHFVQQIRTMDEQKLLVVSDAPSPDLKLGISVPDRR